MITPDVQKIYKNILKLTTAEKMLLVSKILPELSREFEQKEKLNIYDIKGVGKEIWKDTDTQEQTERYPLRGKVISYEDPTEPVAQNEWDVLK
jgi:hypothetical protein